MYADGEHQTSTLLSFPVVFDGLPGPHQDPHQDWKRTAPPFSSSSTAPFPVVHFRGHPEHVVALPGLFSVALPRQRRSRLATRPHQGPGLGRERPPVSGSYLGTTVPPWSHLIFTFGGGRSRRS